MKLYFYRLKLGQLYDDECEVEEKPKTYKAVDSFPECTYVSSIKKSDIGKAIEHYHGESFVVLTENNKEKACDALVEYIERKINSYRNDIEIAEKKINGNQDLIDYINNCKNN